MKKIITLESLYGEGEVYFIKKLLRCNQVLLSLISFKICFIRQLYIWLIG